MTKGRLLAFSDGVIAILITIMVLELRVPKGGHWSDLRDELPVLLAYILSFVFVGIYWTNHHHLLAVVTQVTGGALWANLHLLFWLSLVPFTTDWMSESDFASATVAAYGIDLLACAASFTILQRLLLRSEVADSVLAQAIGADRKGKVSVLLYVVGIALTFVEAWAGLVAFIAVALMWFIPDRRVERALVASGRAQPDD